MRREGDAGWYYVEYKALTYVERWCFQVIVILLVIDQFAGIANIFPLHRMMINRTHMLCLFINQLWGDWLVD